MPRPKTREIIWLWPAEKNIHWSARAVCELLKCHSLVKARYKSCVFTNDNVILLQISRYSFFGINFEVFSATLDKSYQRRVSTCSQLNPDIYTGQRTTEGLLFHCCCCFILTTHSVPFPRVYYIHTFTKSFGYKSTDCLMRATRRRPNRHSVQSWFRGGQTVAVHRSSETAVPSGAWADDDSRYLRAIYTHIATHSADDARFRRQGAKKGTEFSFVCIFFNTWQKLMIFFHIH